jgi:hypothetical protein
MVKSLLQQISKISKTKPGKLRILNSMILINLWISWSHVLLSSTVCLLSLPVELECKVGKCWHISTSTHINGFWYKQLNCATNHLRYFYIMIFNYFAHFACCIMPPMKWINKLVWWIKFAQAIVQVIARFIHIDTVPCQSMIHPSVKHIS